MQVPYDPLNDISVLLSLPGTHLRVKLAIHMVGQLPTWHVEKYETPTTLT